MNQIVLPNSNTPKNTDLASMPINKKQAFQLTEKEVSFIYKRDRFNMETVGENGFPYIQYIGG